MTGFEQEKLQAIEIATLKNGYTRGDRGDYVMWLFDNMHYLKEQIANGCNYDSNTQRLVELRELYHIYIHYISNGR